MAKRTRPTRNATSAPALAAPELDTEFANRLQDPFEIAYMGVLRTNDPLLLERGQGNVQLYRELKRDGKVFDGLQKRQLALIGKTWQVTPVDAKAPNATKDAETLTSILKESAFDRVCSELLEALLAGYAVAEKRSWVRRSVLQSLQAWTALENDPVFSLNLRGTVYQVIFDLGQEGTSAVAGEPVFAFDELQPEDPYCSVELRFLEY